MYPFLKLKRYFTTLTIIGAVMLACVPETIAGEIPKSKEVASTGKLSLANSLDYAPFGYIDKNGSPSGLMVELGKATAQLLGVEMDMLRIPFTSQIPGLMSGRFNLAWSTFTPTKERVKRVGFVVFLNDGVILSTKPENLSRFEKDYPMCGKKIACIKGSTSDFTLDTIKDQCESKELPLSEKFLFEANSDMVQATLSGRVDAYLDDSTAASYYASTSDGRLSIVGKLYSKSPLGVAFKKGDKATAEMIRKAFQILIDNGTLPKILGKYGLSEAMAPSAYIVDEIVE